MVTAHFLDSSALVKRYVNEAGSEWIQTVTTSGQPVLLARISWVEVLSAFARLQREGAWPASASATALRAFQYDWDTQYQVVELDQTVTQLAGQLVQRHPLRAYDSVQLASALKLQPTITQTTGANLVFVTADDRLLKVAESESLASDNPRAHP